MLRGKTKGVNSYSSSFSGCFSSLRHSAISFICSRKRFILPPHRLEEFTFVTNRSLYITGAGFPIDQVRLVRDKMRLIVGLPPYLTSPKSQEYRGHRTRTVIARIVPQGQFRESQLCGVFEAPWTERESRYLCRADVHLSLHQDALISSSFVLCSSV